MLRPPNHILSLTLTLGITNLCIYYFVIYRMLEKLNHLACTLLRLAI